MKRGLSIIFILGIFSYIHATTYYIATNGNDTNNGLSQSSPFKTISKINNIILKAGDSVLFRRGDFFKGQLNITESGALNKPIVIAAYGYGLKPIITGSEQITHWTKARNSIWVANCPQCDSEVNGLYSGSSSLPLGRWPKYDTINGGYNTILSHSGDSSIVSKEQLTTNWAGGTIVARNQEWILDKSVIKAQQGNKLIFDVMPYEPQNYWGYFIQNHPATLNKNMEWYYNPTNKTIGIYCESTRPETNHIEATVYSTCINIMGSFITIRDIELEKTLYCGISGTNVSNLSVQNVTIVNSGGNGIEIKGTGKNIDLEYDTITHINNNGVSIAYYTGFICKNNVLKDIAIAPGLGKSSDGQYEAIQFMSPLTYYTDTSYIEHNTIDSIGYIGIFFQTSNIVIKQNIISHFDLIKDDGGGIYTYNGSQNNYTNQHIISNFISNATDNLYGVSGAPYHGANGIYMDDCAENIEIKNNIVFNCIGGLMLHGTKNLTIIGNTFFNNGSPSSNHGALQISPSKECNGSYNIIKNNIFFSKYPYQKTVWEWNKTMDYSSFGISDSNFYCRPFDTTHTFYIMKSTGSSSVSLSDWKQISSEDIHSKTCPITYKSDGINAPTGDNLNATNPDNTILFFYNDSEYFKVYTLPIGKNYVDVKKNKYSSSVKLAPFTSIILLYMP